MLKKANLQSDRRKTATEIWNLDESSTGALEDSASNYGSEYTSSSIFEGSDFSFDDGDSLELSYPDDKVNRNGAPLLKPRRNCCHSFFVFLQTTAVLANLSMVIIQVLPIVAGTTTLLDVVLRSYFICFSFCFLLAGE